MPVILRFIELSIRCAGLCLAIDDDKAAVIAKHVLQIIAYCLLTPTSLALSRVCIVAMLVSFMCGIAAVSLLWHSTYPDYAYTDSALLIGVISFLIYFLLHLSKTIANHIGI